MRAIHLALFAAFLMGCGAEPEDGENVEESTAAMAPASSVDAWLASQGVKGDELDELIGSDDLARPTFLKNIGKAIGKLVVRFRIGPFPKNLIGNLKLRLGPRLFQELDFVAEPGTDGSVENTLRIVHAQAALRDGAPLDPVPPKTGAKLVAKFGGRADDYRVYEGGEYKGLDGSIITTRVFLRPGKVTKALAIRTVTRKDGSTIVTDLPKL